MRFVPVRFKRDWISGNGRAYRGNRIYAGIPRGAANVLVSRNIAEIVTEGTSRDVAVQPNEDERASSRASKPHRSKSRSKRRSQQR